MLTIVVILFAPDSFARPTYGFSDDGSGSAANVRAYMEQRAMQQEQGCVFVEINLQTRQQIVEIQESIVELRMAGWVSEYVDYIRTEETPTDVDIHISENSESGTTIVRVTATDPNTGKVVSQNIAEIEGPITSWSDPKLTGNAELNNIINDTVNYRSPGYEGVAAVPEPATVFIFGSILSGFGILSTKFKLLLK